MWIAMQGEAGQRMQMSLPELDDRQFMRWAELLRQRLGIDVSPRRRNFLSSKLRTRMRELGIDDFQHYFNIVNDARRGAAEWSLLLDRLTIHETRFLRHRSSFELLQRELPALWQHSEDRSLRVWSVGCASGEEAYTLAMMLDQSMCDLPEKAYYGVIGTDVSLDTLAQARRGIYPAERLCNLDDQMRQGYFTEIDEGFEVNETLRRRVAFSQLNVQHLAQAPFEAMDVIYCQNLLIYFSQTARRQIADSLLHFLKPGGLLIFGVGELLDWRAEGLLALNYEDTLAYRKLKD